MAIVNPLTVAVFNGISRFITSKGVKAAVSKYGTKTLNAFNRMKKNKNITSDAGKKLNKIAKTSKKLKKSGPK